MLLCIDIGNTHIVLGLRHNGEWRYIWRIHTDTRRTADEYGILLRQLVRTYDIDPKSINAAVYSTVVPHLSPIMMRAVTAMFGVTPLEVTYESDIGMKINYTNPQEVGADRLANAVGAIVKFGAPVIVIDLGTTINFDVVSREGHYEGGVIMPGFDISADALFQRTARLPRIAIKRPDRTLGRTTIQSIQSGLYWGLIYAVDGLIEALWRELGYETTLVATGGRGEELMQHSRLIDKYDANITLDGLVHIWQRGQS